MGNGKFYDITTVLEISGLTTTKKIIKIMEVLQQ